MSQSAITKYATLAILGVATIGLAFQALSLSKLDGADRKRPAAVHDLNELLAANDETRLPARDVDKRLTKALRADPLSSEPLYAAMVLQRGEKVAVLDEAVRRNVRSVSARKQRAQMAIDNNNLRRAIGELDVLYGINRGRRDEYADVLASFEARPGGRDILAAALATDPKWKAPVIRRLAATSTDAAFLKQVTADDREAQGLFVRRLLQQGQLEFALLTWFDFADVDPASFSWPVDSEFEGIDAPAPFNWSFAAPDVEMATEGGINVVFLGKEERLIAEQYVALGVGRYVVNLSAEGHVPPAAGTMALEIACAEQDEERVLARTSVFNAASRGGTVTVPVAVPAEACPVQHLRIVATPGEIPRISRIHVSSITIDQLPPARREG